jgi:hypothetical protein
MNAFEHGDSILVMEVKHPERYTALLELNLRVPRTYAVPVKSHGKCLADTKSDG